MVIQEESLGRIITFCIEKLLFFLSLLVKKNTKELLILSAFFLLDIPIS